MGARTESERGDAIRVAALDSLREAGYDRDTLDAIAARAGTDSGELHRRRGRSERLEGAAGHHRECAPVIAVDTGSLRGDLHAIAQVFAERHHADWMPWAELHPGMESHLEPADAVQERAAELEALRHVMQRAVDRGEMAPDNPALDFAPELVIGAVCGRMLMDDAEVDTAYLVRCMDAFVLPVLLRG